MGNKCEPHFCNEKIPKVDNSQWMSVVQDGTYLSEMTIPGTHNSCSFRGTCIAITHTWSLPHQLQAGLRYFDIRIRSVEDRLRLYHGIMKQKMFFDEVLKDFRNFLSKNTSEFVIMAAQKEGDDYKSTKSFVTLYEEYSKDYQDLIVAYEGRDYTIQELRGKILFINLFHSGASSIRNFIVQNKWVVNFPKNIKDKKKNIKRLLNRAILNKTKGKPYLNYLSGSSDYALVTPARCAYETNKIPLKYVGRMGICLFDFPGEALIDHLIEQNFRPGPSDTSSKEVEVLNGSYISFININTLKYLSFKGGKLYCGKKLYIIQINKSCNSSLDELVRNGEQISMKLGNSETLFNFQIFRSQKNISNNTDVVHSGDIVLLKMNNNYLCSDYDFVNKEEKTQEIKENQEERNDKNEWLIEVY